MDARTLLHAVWRHKAVFGVLVLLGIVAGAAFTLIRPPMLASKVLVVVAGSRYIRDALMTSPS